MKVTIKVWDRYKPHGTLDGMPCTTILEYDKFNKPEVVGHGVPIERCVYNKIFDCLEVSLDEYPARIDADPRFESIDLLSKDRAVHFPDGYTTLDIDKGKGIVLYDKLAPVHSPDKTPVDLERSD